MIDFQGATFSYGDGADPVLNAVTFTIAPGERVVLAGPNGCGKTTLLKHMNALLLPTTGDVSIDGLNTRDRRHAPEIRRRVGMVFQNPDHQIVGTTVEEDVAFGPGNLGLPPEEIRRRVAEALAAVRLDTLRQRPPQTLSGGEKRLLAVAGALAMEPRYLVLDEPTAYLDPAGRRRVVEVLARLHGEGIAVVQVSHDLDDILDAGRLLIMAGGEIRADGPPRAVLSRPDALESIGLDLPPVVRLLERLRREGVELPADALTVEEAARALHALIAVRGPNGAGTGRSPCPSPEAGKGGPADATADGTDGGQMRGGPS